MLRNSSDFLIGAAIGSGSAGLAAELGGADFLLAINAGRLRNMGAPSIACMLPVFDACSDTEEFARRELLPQVGIPVLLGINVWGERGDDVRKAASLRDDGFAGAVNFPSCMHYSRPMQQILSRAGRGIEREIEQLRAVQKAGMTSMLYCATRTQARLAADAGLDYVCLNLGWNVGGALGHRQRTSLEEVATVARDLRRLIKRISPQTRFMLEGGPIATAEDLARIVSQAPIDGYIGGSTIDRIPVEVSVADQIAGFRQAGRRRSTLDRESAGLVAWSRKFGIVGRSPSQLGFLRRLRAFCGAAEPVLIVVENGSDPGPVLSALGQSRRKSESRRVLHVDVAGEEFPVRARNILFGHVDTLDRQVPALADDEIGVLAIHSANRLPPAVQRRLAQTLRDGEFRVSGTRRLLPVRPRVVFVSQASDLLIADARYDLKSSFDPQLAEQMQAFKLIVPPLRERHEDIWAIVAKISGDNLETALSRTDFSTAAQQHLLGYSWPGNESELRGVLGRLAGRSGSGPVRTEELLEALGGGTEIGRQFSSEKDRVVAALWRHGYSRTRTAAALGISRKTLYNKMNKFGLSG